MSLLPTEDDVMLSDAARGFLDRTAPVTHLRGLRDAGATHDAALWSEMAAMGWAGVLVPEAQGGSDMGHAAAGVLAREMGKTLAASPFLSTAVIAATALRQVSNDRSAKALAEIAAGRLTYALAVDEGPKHNPHATRLEAVAEGNGFRLHGRKSFVVDGGTADRALVLARTDNGLTLFDLPLDRDGITSVPKAMIDSRDAADLDFGDVIVTGDDVLGRVDDAMAVLRPALHAGQAALAAEMTGLTAGAFGMTVAYLQERKQFGVPIGAFQALQHRAAHLWSETEITASTVLNAGRILDSGEDATLAVSLGKARATKTAELAVQEGVQIHGGIGMSDAHDMGFFMKRARVSAEWLGDYSYHAETIARLRGF
ncbi:acyl-CoA dehydrogenase family protein [Tateyamaria sp.]|uniref:acyl-CoA dehydrogenase family protein n=1 Tax=Tateyamaria sp. TaxID=1929288 RepID=UPI003B2190F2